MELPLNKSGNDEKYDGDLMNGVPHGYGTKKYSDGRVYTGYWCNGIREGRGKVTNNIFGLSYEGEWKADQPDGNGIITIEDTTYIGEFKEGSRHGFGYQIAKNGVVSVGEWVKDKLTGKGIITFPIDDDLGLVTHAGEFNEFKPNNLGIRVNEGMTTCGEWQGHDLNGLGIFKCEDFTKCGEWENDELNGIGLSIWGNVSSVGEFSNDELNGIGCQKVNGFDKYYGDFQNGLKHGFGMMVYKNGARYTGEWAFGLKHGKGTFFGLNGECHNGIWVDDKMITTI